MTVHDVAPARHDARVPRARPCQAKGMGPGACECGATPASRWHRACGWGHARDVWLCGVHAALILAAEGSCADCVARGVPPGPRRIARLAPADLILLGHAAGPAALPKEATALVRS